MLFKVRGKSQGHMLNIVVKPCKQDKDRIVWIGIVKLTSLGLSNLLHILVVARKHLSLSKVRRSKVMVTC